MLNSHFHHPDRIHAGDGDVPVPRSFAFAQKAVALLAMVTVAGCAGTGTEPVPVSPVLTTVDGEEVAQVTAATGRWTAYLISEGVVVDATVSDREWDIAFDDDGISIRPNYREQGAADDEGMQATLTLDVDVPAASGGGEERVVVEIAITRLPMAWELISSGANLPPGREYFAWWIDPADKDRAFLLGGFHYQPVQFTPANDLWEIDLVTDTWTDHGDQAEVVAGGGAHAATTSSGDVYRFGGATVEAAGNLGFPFEFSAFDAAPEPNFSVVTVDDAPDSGRYQPAFFWEERLDAFVVVGGQDRGGNIAMDVAVLDPVDMTWSSLAVEGDPNLPNAAPPVPRLGFAWTHLAAQGRLFLFGGDVGGPTTGCNCINDTWALDFDVSPPQWTLLATDVIPQERRNAAYGIDDVGERMFVYGGTPNGLDTAQGVWALDLTRGEEEWTRIGSLDGTGPVARTSGGLLFDRGRDRLLMGFGNNAQGVQTNLWSLDLSAEDAN